MGLLKVLCGEEPWILEKVWFQLTHPGDKGAYGEYLIKHLFKSIRFRGYHKVIGNVYVPYKGGTSEIDIILIHEKGIFVIESKNYSGCILGSVNQQQWTQVFNKKGNFYFYNPIKQNRTHISVLSEYLGIDKNKMKSYVVFSEDCQLKKVPANTREYVVTQRNHFLSIIKADIKSRQTLFSKSEIDLLYKKIKLIANVSQKVKNQHIKNIQSKYNQ